MKIIVAFDSFKGCMSASEACHSAATAIRNKYEHTEVVEIPISDGGEGLVDCISAQIHTHRVCIEVHGPMMSPVMAEYAISADGKTAYMEMAAAAGLTLVPLSERNPVAATTYGVGEMIRDAVLRGCKEIVMGIGGSATCDGGAGMIDYLKPHLPLGVAITVACDVTNPLYGENGAAYVFATQKGATPEAVEILDQRLIAFARTTETQGLATPEMAQRPGAGAAGGLGYGLMAYLGARLVPGINMILDTVGFDERIKDADLIITGEGKSDQQTLMGKVAQGVLLRGRAQGKPVHLLSGSIDQSARDVLLEAGFASIRGTDHYCDYPVVPCPLEILMRHDVSTTNLKRGTLDIVRTVVSSDNQ